MNSIISIVKKGGYVFGAYLLSVSTVFGQTEPQVDWIEGAITAFGNFVSMLIPILIALAFLVFVWGLIVFILASGDEAAKDEGKRKMIWGIIALFVIIAVWGIIGILQDLIGSDDSTGTYPEWPVRTS